MTSSIHFSMSECVDLSHCFPAIWPPYIHSFDWITLVNKFRCFDDKWVPRVEIFNLARDSAFCLCRFAHVLSLQHLLIKMTEELTLVRLLHCFFLSRNIMTMRETTATTSGIPTTPSVTGRLQPLMESNR